MNQCFGCNTCASADKPLEGFIRNLPMETSHHRVEGQSTKCGFGLQGVCCRLCSNGPCRITPKAPRGICGATADVIVARNFLRAVASGSGCYIHIVENTALNVKKTAEIKGEIKGEKSLARLAEIFGVLLCGKNFLFLAANNCVSLNERPVLQHIDPKQNDFPEFLFSLLYQELRCQIPSQTYCISPDFLLLQYTNPLEVYVHQKSCSAKAAA